MALDNLSRWDGWSTLTKQDQSLKYSRRNHFSETKNISNHKELGPASKTFLKTFLDKNIDKIKDKIVTCKYEMNHETEWSGYKGKEFQFDKGIFYAPYIPLYTDEVRREKERVANEKAAKDTLGEELEGLTDL